jgi:DNA-binding LacI/PurR family transcriptional regulator
MSVFRNYCKTTVIFAKICYDERVSEIIKTNAAGLVSNPTLADVARRSGVAISTVSRSFTDPNRVSARTRERILKAAEELDYEPLGQRKRPAQTATRTVALFVTDITNPFFFQMIRGTQQQLRAAGYNQMLIDTEESDELEQNLLESLGGSFDGAVLGSSRLSDAKLKEWALRIPLVAINRQVTGVASVVIDTPAGVVQALAHLRSMGHRDIAFASGPRASWMSEGRWRALDAAAEGYGVRLHRLGPFVPRVKGGAAAADALLHSHATACIAFNDLLAIGMLGRLRERNVRVPEDVSIVGCDDIFGSDFCDPPLTTVSAPIEQGARTAVSMLVGRLDSTSMFDSRTEVILPTNLTIRKSSGPVASR